MNSKVAWLTRGSILGVIAAIGGAALVSAAIYSGVDEVAGDPKDPLPVAIAAFSMTDSYERTASFVGIVRASTDSNLGFEVSGTLNQMPVREGTRVARGDVIAVLDSDRRNAQTRASSAEVTRLEAEVELAQLRSKRLAEIRAKGLVAEQSYDDARLNESALLAALESARARLESAQLDVAKSTLKAPFDGVIAQRMAQPGTVLAAGTPVVRLVASGKKEAHIGLPSERETALTVGSQYNLSIDGTPYAGTLKAIRADVDPTTLTVDAVFDLPDAARALAGEPVLLELQERVPSEGGWLPLTALLEGDRGLWNVLAVRQEGADYRAVRESVEVIYVDNERVFVRGTLPAGASVIATGLQRLSPGSRVVPLDGEA